MWGVSTAYVVFLLIDQWSKKLLGMWLGDMTQDVSKHYVFQGWCTKFNVYKRSYFNDCVAVCISYYTIILILNGVELLAFMDFIVQYLYSLMASRKPFCSFIQPLYQYIIKYIKWRRKSMTVRHFHKNSQSDLKLQISPWKQVRMCLFLASINHMIQSHACICFPPFPNV